MLIKKIMKKIKNWVKKKAAIMSLALANVEKNVFGQNGEPLSSYVNQERRHTQGQLADSLVHGEITQEVIDLRWRTYKVMRASEGVTAEIVGYDNLNQDFIDRDAVLLTGSTDNEFCALAWQKSHSGLQKITHIQFADTQRGELSLVEQLGVFFAPAAAPLRATFIVDPDNIIQHVTVNNLNVGRSPEETLRVLDALQSGALCACNRTVGGDTL